MVQDVSRGMRGGDWHSPQPPEIPIDATGNPSALPRQTVHSSPADLWGTWVQDSLFSHQGLPGAPQRQLLRTGQEAEAQKGQ